MEKNSTIFLMLILIALCWFGIFKFSGMAVMYLGESASFAGRNIIVEKINSGATVITVDGEQDIFRKGDTKTINGIEIHVSKIIYFPEIEDRKVELNLASNTVCSNGKCEIGEDPDNCCTDCGCQEGYVCRDNACEYEPKNLCETDEDCNDLTASTNDLCFGTPKTCHYQIIQCNSDLECDDKNTCTKDWCSFNECINQPITGCKIKEIPSENQKEGFFARLFKRLFGN